MTSEHENTGVNATKRNDGLCPVSTPSEDLNIMSTFSASTPTAGAFLVNEDFISALNNNIEVDSWENIPNRERILSSSSDEDTMTMSQMSTVSCDVKAIPHSHLIHSWLNLGLVTIRTEKQTLLMRIVIQKCLAI